MSLFPFVYFFLIILYLLSLASLWLPMSIFSHLFSEESRSSRVSNNSFFLICRTSWSSAIVYVKFSRSDTFLREILTIIRGCVKHDIYWQILVLISLQGEFDSFNVSWSLFMICFISALNFLFLSRFFRHYCIFWIGSTQSCDLCKRYIPLPFEKSKLAPDLPKACIIR